jgi:hypothetical protein
MKTEKELADWLSYEMALDVEGYAVGFGALHGLFTGMKLVPADAVVLTLEDAAAIDEYSATCTELASETQSSAFRRLAQAIEQAKGGNND